MMRARALPGLALLGLSQLSCLCIHSGTWIYKTGADPQARDVSLDPVRTTIDQLRAFPHVERPEHGRIAPVELTTFELRDVELTSFQRAPDNDIHLVLSDEHGHTVIAEAAPPFCTDKASPWRSRIVAARAVIEDVIGPAALGWGHWIVSVAGPGYLDTVHGQPSAAPNGIEIHPLLAICFGRGCALPDVRIDPGAREPAHKSCD